MTDQPDAMARRIADEHTGPNNRGHYLWEPRYAAALAAIRQASEARALPGDGVLREAAQVVLDGLNARIDEASANGGHSVPVFAGIADLSDALAALSPEAQPVDAEEDDRSWLGKSIDRIDAMDEAAMQPVDAGEGRFKLGDRVSKKSGSEWHGTVVGFYSTGLTPIGYAVESERERGSVQIYPEAALSPNQGGGG